MATKRNVYNEDKANSVFAVKIRKLFEECYRDNLHSIWANRELYRKGNSDIEFFGILEKNMRPVYDSARRQGYDVWDKRFVD